MRVEDVSAAIEPVVSSLGCALFDVVIDAKTLRVTVSREGGLDLDAITDATRAVSAALETAGVDFAGYALEVSSPGLERPLRTAAHFAGAVGATVSVKSRDAAGVASRRRGVLISADEASIDFDVDGEITTIPYTAITQARTVFDWGQVAKPTRRRAKRSQQRSELSAAKGVDA